MPGQYAQTRSVSDHLMAIVLPDPGTCIMSNISKKKKVFQVISVPLLFEAHQFAKKTLSNKYRPKVYYWNFSVISQACNIKAVGKQRTA